MLKLYVTVIYCCNLSRDMTCVRLEACFGPCVASVSLATVPYVDAFHTWMYVTATCIAVGQRASMYSNVRCRKAHSHSVQRRILLAHTWAYGDVSHRMSTQDSADAKIICHRNLLQSAAQIELLSGMLHPSTYDDAVCMNHHQSNDLLPLHCSRR